MPKPDPLTGASGPFLLEARAWYVRGVVTGP